MEGTAAGAEKKMITGPSAASLITCVSPGLERGGGGGRRGYKVLARCAPDVITHATRPVQSPFAPGGKGGKKGGGGDDDERIAKDHRCFTFDLNKK